MECCGFKLYARCLLIGWGGVGRRCQPGSSLYIVYRCQCPTTGARAKAWCLRIHSVPVLATGARAEAWCLFIHSVVMLATGARATAWCLLMHVYRCSPLEPKRGVSFLSNLTKPHSLFRIVLLHGFKFTTLLVSGGGGCVEM